MGQLIRGWSWVPVVVALATSATLSAEPQSIDPYIGRVLAELDPMVSCVATTAMTEHGVTARLVVVSGGAEHVHSKAFIQWILLRSNDTDECLANVVSEVAVSEVNDAVAVMIRTCSVELNEARKWIFHLTTVNPHTGEVSKLKVEPVEPGSYRLDGR